MEKLRSGVHLNPGSKEEVEIRGCSVWAVEVRKIIMTVVRRLLSFRLANGKRVITSLTALMT